MKRWLLMLLMLLAACADRSKTPSAADHLMTPARNTGGHDSTSHVAAPSQPPTAPGQISQYIRRMFQDRAGNVWFGTTGDGVARYDGHTVDYFHPANGFASNWVSSIVQDPQGELWFGTGGGVSHFDGRRFTNYTTQDGLVSDQVWCTLLDKSGGLWFGTEEGVSRYDGTTFTAFPIPAADLSKFPYYKYPKQINWMIQDRNGNIWFASNGSGAYKYDPSAARGAAVSALTNITEKDGLCNNFVETIMEDRDGNIWFGTRYGGLCKYDPSAAPKTGGKTFTTYTRNELKGDGVWTLHQTSDGTIWIAMARSGLCRYDGVGFTCYDEKDGEGIRVVQSLLEDSNGQLWVGTSNGVYKWDGLKFWNWTKRDAIGG